LVKLFGNAVGGCFIGSGELRDSLHPAGIRFNSRLLSLMAHSIRKSGAVVMG